MNFLRCSSVRVARRALETQDASGERTAPLGSRKPPEESNVRPVPSRFAQRLNWNVISALLSLESPPAGAMIDNSPRAVRSMRSSRLSRQNSKNRSSVRHSAGGNLTSRAEPFTDVEL